MFPPSRSVLGMIRSQGFRGRGGRSSKLIPAHRITALSSNMSSLSNPVVQTLSFWCEAPWSYSKSRGDKDLHRLTWIRRPHTPVTFVAITVPAIPTLEGRFTRLLFQWGLVDMRGGGMRGTDRERML